MSGDVLWLEGTESLGRRARFFTASLATEQQQLEVMCKPDFFQVAVCKPMFKLLQLVE